jgi:hypothetical protein
MTEYFGFRQDAVSEANAVYWMVNEEAESKPQRSINPKDEGYKLV